MNIHKLNDVRHLYGEDYPSRFVIYVIWDVWEHLEHCFVSPHHVAADAGGSGSLIAGKNQGGDLLLCIKFCSCLT